METQVWFVSSFDSVGSDLPAEEVQGINAHTLLDVRAVVALGTERRLLAPATNQLLPHRHEAAIGPNICESTLYNVAKNILAIGALITQEDITGAGDDQRLTTRPARQI